MACEELVEYVRCVCLRAAWVERGRVDERIWFGLYQSSGNRGSVGRMSVFGCGGVGDVGGEWVGVLDQGLEGLGGVMSM